MRYFALTIVSLVYFLLNGYIVANIFKVAKDSVGIKFAVLMSIIVGACAIFTLVTYIAPINVGIIIGKIGSYWMGISLVTFVLLLLTNTISYLIKIGLNINISDAKSVITALVIMICIFVIGINTEKNVEIVNYDVKINKELKGDEELKVIAISDLHLGYINNNEELKKSVDKINSLEPDMVVILGDLFDGNFKAVQNNSITKELLSSFKTKYGTFLCWGNHDAGENFNDMREFIKDTNINLLEDEAINIDDRFIVLGRLDASPIGYQGSKKRNENYNLEISDPNIPVIVLDHQPSNVEQYKGDVDLILSGHTHGGQIYPFNLVTGAIFLNDYGYKEIQNNIHSIVTSGLGTWGPPIRIGTKNEIVSIKISN